MSKILALMATYTQTGAKIRRTIEHSPDFGDESADNDDSPSGRIPPGGMLTG
ncbi:hypothetical protein [Halopiger xanaduensis]|uniref:Uncharacterized protein n=1 Tax=Halopiger xanaduensis (strain DSM 18323 / JCM 14033 / SH-6) TaxID=797210 RepID=F8D2Y1_HALXS|nr:hypothetical protein [Halopiger xanaduensis]AEH36125.1 hypothetical protein Halxa_1493 [Halopiger xanaduensis SH-6]